MSEETGSERLIAGRYRLLSPLGEGGMGTVWRAGDEVLRREVAVKEVRAPAGLAAHETERLYARLEREAWAAARVADRRVVTVYDVATEDGRPWIVMELVRGVSLAELLDAEGPLPPERAAHIGAEVLGALRSAHAAGVLHRDVKPANVLMSNNGRVVLTDFGIATVEGSSALTMTGEVIGSPEFLAPERALGRTPGPESDLWSLGVLLYAAVEGNSPFRQATPLGTLRAVVDEELPPPRRAGPLGPVVEALLRKDPAQRLPADRAEDDLRLVAAGGTPGRYGPDRDGPDGYGSGGYGSGGRGPGGSPYGTTVAGLPGPGPTARQPARPAATGSGSASAPGSGSASGSGSGSASGHGVPSSVPAGGARRDGRVAGVLVAGVVVLALAVAGLTYALTHRDTGGDGDRADGQGASAPKETGSSRKGEGGASVPVSPSASGSARDTASARSVTVTVTGAHTDYRGSCPPSRADAPAFTLTLSVNALPAQVRYRWRSEDEKVMDEGWKTLSFPEGGGTSRTDTVFVTTDGGSGTLRDAVSVEVRTPARVTSEPVPFSVTCVEETPSDGASPTDSGSASP
ncbi:serine/threonine-protein kinase [Streptomyces sp. ACT015]|uniref:serine/threonine-protein kinase n=1 Tax=Streptomyces sp. ACT015 TaxID=3134807 RepID=UPI003D16494F